MIRQARADDASAIRAIYAPIVESTAISFEIEPPSVDDLADRIDAALGTHDWLVAERDGAIAGYAYGGTHRQRAAYRYASEVSVYVHDCERGGGIGRMLYEALFESLRKRDFHTALAGISLPNDASVALHRGVGFEPIGVFRDVGYKFDRWHDVSWWQRRL